MGQSVPAEFIRAPAAATRQAECAVADTLQHAADLSGATLNQFVVQSALEKARAVIANEERDRAIQFSAKDAAAFIQMIENPPKPNKALAKAMARYKQKVKDGALDTTAGRTPST